jgi:hypothetical protein
MSLRVISVLDKEYKNDGYEVIGVAVSDEVAMKMIVEYFGDEMKITKTHDVRDSGIEYIYDITCNDNLRQGLDDYVVITHSFTLNKI